MRILLADQDSTQLEVVARMLRGTHSLDVVTSKANGLDLLRQNEYQLLIACEQLADGSGLDLLSQAERRHPDVMRVFAAEPQRLRLLANRLRPFKLFQTLSYPIAEDALRSILQLAEAAISIDAQISAFEHVVLEAPEPPPSAKSSRKDAEPAGAPTESPVVAALMGIHETPVQRESLMRRALRLILSRPRLDLPPPLPRPKRAGSLTYYTILAGAAVASAVTAVAGVAYVLTDRSEEITEARRRGSNAFPAEIDYVPRAAGPSLAEVRARRDQRILGAAPAAVMETEIRPTAYGAESPVGSDGTSAHVAEVTTERVTNAVPDEPGSPRTSVAMTFAPTGAQGASGLASGTADPGLPEASADERPAIAARSPGPPAPLEPPPVVREAYVAHRVSPDYPLDAAQRGVEGSIVLEFTIAADGRARDIRIVHADPPQIFERAALAALRRWRFEPRMEDGVAVDWPTQVRMEFRLNE